VIRRTPPGGRKFAVLHRLHEDEHLPEAIHGSACEF
jgi:hypothetical protein